ncbi:MAG: bile acid:sodium symporter family protein [Gammaproteobacteria bacterium]|nr:bile acid:sodium symporter family protein [Gammaproteobacteria bacterium]MBL7000708.1 bile acid:sodium symporter family protein [Gammaproteobacteria bacterium]
MNQDFVLALALPVTLFCIMFGMGSSLTPANFKLLLQAPATVFSGIASQMLLLPLLAFALLYNFSLTPEIFIGFMILALSPGGTTSNMFAYLAGGNLALSISLTAIVSVLTPFSIPLVAGWILASQLGSATTIQLPFIQTLLKLGMVTLLPVLLGMLLRHFKKSFCIRHEYWLTRLPLVMLLLVIAGIIHQNWQNMPSFIEQTGFPALLLASLSLLAGYLFARSLKRNESDSRTIAIETSIQNGGTAILVTGTILHNPAMTIAPVMYGILMLIPVLIYLLLLKITRRVKR